MINYVKTFCGEQKTSLHWQFSCDMYPFLWYHEMNALCCHFLNVNFCGGHISNSLSRRVTFYVENPLLDASLSCTVDNLQLPLLEEQFWHAFSSSVRICHQNCCLHLAFDSPFQSGLGDKGDLSELISVCHHSERPGMMRILSEMLSRGSCSPLFCWDRMEFGLGGVMV